MTPLDPLLASDADPAQPVPPRLAGVVLVVDDEPVVRKLTGLFLESLGYTPMFAADGTEAVRVHAEHRDTLTAVFLDLTMPGLDGLHVFRRIREAGGTTPVVLMSGHPEHEVRETFGDLGFQGFLSKPFNRADVAARLADLRE